MEMTQRLTVQRSCPVCDENLDTTEAAWRKLVADLFGRGGPTALLQAGICPHCLSEGHERRLGELRANWVTRAARSTSSDIISKAVALPFDLTSTSGACW